MFICARVWLAEGETSPFNFLCDFYRPPTSCLVKLDAQMSLMRSYPVQSRRRKLFSDLPIYIVIARAGLD